jgi:hypothetical protein
MILARAIMRNGQRVAVIGLTGDNMTQLLTDKGIIATDADVFGGAVLLIFGLTDADIIHTLQPYIDGDTEFVQCTRVELDANGDPGGSWTSRSDWEN